MGGSLFGLEVELYVSYNKNLTLFNSYTSFNGAYVRIENSSFLYDDSLDNGIYVSPGKWTNAKISRVVMYTLAKPYSSCDLDNETGQKNVHTYLLDLIYHSPYIYTQQTCIMACLQYELKNKCNCTYAQYLPLLNDTVRILKFLFL